MCLISQLGQNLREFAPNYKVLNHPYILLVQHHKAQNINKRLLFHFQLKEDTNSLYYAEATEPCY